MNFLYQQLYEKLREDIFKGYLVKDARLPSIRQCEKDYKVSKTSVEKAYQMLVDEGLVKAKPNAGYFVSVDYHNLKMRKQVFEQETIYDDKIQYDFRSQSIDMESFDLLLWKKYLKQSLEESYALSTYGDAQGELPLRKALQRYAYDVRGVLCEVDQIIVGASFQSLLYLLCGFLDKKMVIGMEKGSFDQAEQVFLKLGFCVKYVEHDEHGILIDSLIQQHIDILYINTGSSGILHHPLKAKSREELLRWLKHEQTYLIEDDHNGELRYMSKGVRSLQGECENHIFYIGSFSRILLPSLRISYLVMNQTYSKAYLQSKETYAPTASKLEQLALARYLTDGHMQRHVKKLKKRYLKKANAMYLLLCTYFTDATITLEEASLQFAICFRNYMPLTSFVKEAKANHIAINSDNKQTIYLSFAAIPITEMEAGITKIVELICKNT